MILHNLCDSQTSHLTGKPCSTHVLSIPLLIVHTLLGRKQPHVLLFPQVPFPPSFLLLRDGKTSFLYSVDNVSDSITYPVRSFISCVQPTLPLEIPRNKELHQL